MFERITVEPGKLNGQPAIRGLRITVAHIVRLVAAGRTLAQIQDDFPFIEADDVVLLANLPSVAEALAEGAVVAIGGRGLRVRRLPLR